ncbi:MAG TPA: DUF2339 domain-containing protein [Novimethylophilus sp.]|uniref:DUF2339 domain-containing protein n=1 Tax=Novimethylophilus sp. TaxID=2137426 RepID=UPI002F4280F6
MKRGPPSRRRPQSLPPRPQSLPAKARLATQLLGWGGAAALVLAASYIVRLAIASGWLTPERQIGLAVIGALAMIGIGLWLRRSESSGGGRAYAGLLPAGGIIILFIAIYAAHLYYGLVGAPAALAAVTLACLLSLWLCHVFQSTLYAFFAVAGTYSVPFLLRSLMLDITDLAIYFASWSAVFCMFSIWVGSRAVYLLALYMALIGFDWAWRDGSYADQWLSAGIFQTALLVIFAGTAAIYSVRRQSPLNQEAAVAHLPALLVFYFLQYALFKQHIPALAPWVAVASAAIVALCYLLARNAAGKELAGGRMLLQAYVALVLFHAGYIESIPYAWAPWVAFLLVPATAAYGALRRDMAAPGRFVWLAVIAIFLINYLRIVAGFDRGGVTAPDLLAVCYALELYGGYYLARRANSLQQAWPLLLLGGHLAAIAAAVQVFHDRIAVSLTWGILAVVCLLIALRFKDKLLGKSSLLIFAISAGKVLFYDLASSAPTVRIFTLLVVGCSFYLGGWLYRKIELLE